MALIRLSGPQRREIAVALKTAFPDPQRMENFLQTFNKSFIDVSVAGDSFADNVRNLVVEAEHADEPWLDLLLEEASRLVPADTVLAALVATLTARPLPVGVSHFDVCRLAGSYLMVDRAGLRASLRSINEPLGNRILVVTGEKKSGKSHSVQLITYLNEVLGTFSYVPIDLEAFKRMLGPDRVIEPTDIVEQLVKGLRYDLDFSRKEDEEQWSRWILDFCNNFEIAALEDPKHRWVVIDAFNSVLVTQAVFDLIKELSIRISKTLPRFRLVLIGYDQTFPSSVQPIVTTERIEPIGYRHLVQFFADALTQASIAVDEGKLESAVEDALGDLDTADPEFLVDLAPRLITALANATAKATS